MTPTEQVIAQGILLAVVLLMAGPVIISDWRKRHHRRR
jgi:hypothetical protein